MALLTRSIVAGALVVALVAPTAATGCKSTPTYLCSSNTACVSESGESGLCEQNQFCSFPDTACTESGRRYPDGAGDGLALACVSAPASRKCIATFALGAEHTCVVRVDGSLSCWGKNADGQLGDGTTQSRSAAVRVAFPPNVKIAKVSPGEEHTCALDNDGAVWCWGSNAVGQLGIGNQENASTPQRVTVARAAAPGGTSVPLRVTALSVGGKHSCAVADHSVFCWGENSDGQCGTSSEKADDLLVPTEVAGLEGIDQVASGDEFTCAHRDDKAVLCWGANAEGELGNGTTTPSATPVKVALSSVDQLTAGDEHACVVKDDGSVWCWGYGQSGALGNGAQDNKLVPTVVGRARAIVTSGQAFHTCSLSNDGMLDCWGANDVAQIAESIATPNILAPKRIALVTVTAAGAGGKHSCATTQDGSLWCWGSNADGQLGDGTTGGLSESPKRIAFCP